MQEENIVNISAVEDKIYTVRGVKVMLDSELSEIYRVPIKRINEQVKRNIERFPSDFMFQLNDYEFKNLQSQNATSEQDSLRSQNATLKSQRGKHKKYLPFVFTEQGVYMLATVLRSTIATQVNLQIMRTFVKVKNQSIPYFNIIQRLSNLEADNKETRDLLNTVIEVVASMSQLQDEAKKETKQIGFINE
ncbi:MAG: ORF6N domain-containing protein [Sulfurimonas sp.]|uniref:ORF6N domain-containing protein n=1 Tax=Sulfurimonas sp. TaxID=2022749 RepID=UPI0026290DCB|nr:ORF6N domain-containing protein [Sulfurimonas sp.]MDD2651649.1 ORF6N domain-containing protein [Sulfurimonas sp.]MDD3451460.1 ORF6N domain-containing protein [Sulfurimonas sp.]